MNEQFYPVGKITVQYLFCNQVLYDSGQKENHLYAFSIGFVNISAVETFALFYPYSHFKVS